MWAQSNLWACVGIFVSGLMKLRLENLYLNNYKLPIVFEISIEICIVCSLFFF